MLDGSRELNAHAVRADVGDPEIDTRIAQYEMAFRMQTSVPELTDLSRRAASTSRPVRPRRRERPARSPPTACSPAGWPSAACGSSSSTTAAGTSTATCPTRLREPVPATPISRRAALVKDLKQRGLLDDTLVIWGGEFGRTIYSPGRADRRQLRPRPSPALLHHVDGRRRHQAGHRPTARPTTSATTSSKDPVHVHDLHATILHLLGIDHERLTYRFQGRDFRLTDVHGKVVDALLA